MSSVFACGAKEKATIGSSFSKIHYSAGSLTVIVSLVMWL